MIHRFERLDFGLNGLLSVGRWLAVRESCEAATAEVAQDGRRCIARGSNYYIALPLDDIDLSRVIALLSRDPTTEF